MLKKFCPANEVQKMEAEFWSLEMKGSDILGYNDKFHETARLVPHLVTPETKRIQRYIWGLVPQIRSMVTTARPATMEEAMELVGSLTDDMVRNGTFGKVQVGEKRKFDNQSFRGNNTFKKPARAIKNYVMAAPGKGKSWLLWCQSKVHPMWSSSSSGRLSNMWKVQETGALC
jgi:hypothetical protein